MLNVLGKHSLLSVENSGFGRKRSRTHNVTKRLDIMADKNNQKIFVCDCAMNFTSAFDSINHLKF